MIDKSFFKALIVDDEQHGRDQVAFHLNRHDDIQIIGFASSVDEALEIINGDIPDLIFLDIEMPNKNGFELISNMNGLKSIPRIVFVTAYNQYAIQAIRQSALDYILKPIDKNEFDEALIKFRQQSSKQNLQEGLSTLLNRLGKSEKLRFNQKGKTIFIDMDEIIYCKADGNYTEIFIDDQHKEVISHLLSHVHELLNQDFQRLGRSIIINKKYLSKVDRTHCFIEFVKCNKKYSLSVSAGIIQKV